MKKSKENAQKKPFEQFAAAVTIETGSTPAIIIAFFIIIVWAICGPIFHYSENW